MVLRADNREPRGQVIDLRPHFGANPTARMVPNRRFRRWIRNLRRKAPYLVRMIFTAALILLAGAAAFVSFVACLTTGGKYR